MRQVTKFCWRYLLPLLVAAAVSYYFYTKLRLPELWSDSVIFRPQWLLAAGICYLIAYYIWGRFSVTLLRNQGGEVSVATGLRAYFVSQFGKYVPGKVWVIVIRVGMLGKIGISRTAVGITAMYETLTMMAAGAAIGMIFLPASAWDNLFQLIEKEGYSLPFKSDYLVMPFALAPILLVGLNRFVNRMNRWRKGADAAQLPRVKLHYVLIGLVQNSVGWFFLGLSLWLTAKGLSPETPDLTPRSFLNLTSLNAIAYVFGFVILFLPAGAGARELALQALLAIEFSTAMNPTAADGLAAVVAIVLRLVWTTFEMITAGLLYHFAADTPEITSLRDEPA